MKKSLKVLAPLALRAEKLNKAQKKVTKYLMKELGVKVMYAGSPQAKGRIENLFGTFQDRVIKEMRD